MRQDQGQPPFERTDAGVLKVVRGLVARGVHAEGLGDERHGPGLPLEDHAGGHAARTQDQLFQVDVREVHGVRGGPPADAVLQPRTMPGMPGMVTPKPFIGAVWPGTTRSCAS